MSLVNLWPLQKRIHEKSKTITLYPPDFTSSCDSDPVVSAGDMGYNLFMLNTTISEDLSSNSAKSTHPRHFPFFPPSFGDYFQWVETQAQEVLRISNSPARPAAWLPAGTPSYLLSLCFVSSLDVEIIWRACSGLYFGTTATMDPCLLPQTIFFSVLSRISPKSQAIRITSMGLYWPHIYIISNINIVLSTWIRSLRNKGEEARVKKRWQPAV